MRLFLLVLASLLTAAVFAQEIPLVVSHTYYPFLAQNQDWALAQAPDHSIWMANSGGVLRFDGEHWEGLPLPNRQMVRAIGVDGMGRVFAGGYGEFGYWELEGHQWVYHSLSQSLEDERAQREEIWHILMLPNGVLFQSFSVLYYYDYERVTVVMPPGPIMFAHAMEEDVLIPVIEEGLYRWRPGGEMAAVPGTNLLAGKRTAGIIQWGQGWLIATESSGCWIYERGHLTRWSNPYNELLKSTQVNRLLRLQDGRLAVGTILDGLFLFGLDGQLELHLNEVRGLQDNTVLSLLEDHEHNLWVGLNRGADLVALGDGLRYYEAPRDHSLGSVYTATLWRDTLYLGTNRGLFRRRWGSEEPFELLPGTQGQVWELKVLPDGQLLCGHNNGTFVLPPRGALRWVSEITGGWQTLTVPGRPDRLLQSTYTGLISLEKTEPGGHWAFRERLGDWVAPIEQIAYGDEGILWAAHASRGLYRLAFGPDWQTVLRREEWTQGIPDPFDMELIRLADTLLVKSGDGYLCWQDEEQRFTPLTNWRGRALVPGARFLPGVDGQWFLLSPHSLSWFRQEERVLRIAPAMLSGNRPIVPLDNGYYLICLHNGYVLLPIADQRAQEPPVPLLLDRVISGGATYRLAQPALEDEPSLTLAAGRTDLQAFFSQPSFAQSCRYRYRLLGWQEQWSAWSEKADANFLRIPHGTYVLEVESDWGLAPARLLITVPPRWYQRDWLKVVGLFGLGLLLWGGVRLHRWRLAQQERRLILERERKLQQERIRLRNEQLQADVLRKSKELANSTFNLVQKNEILRQLRGEIDQLKQEASVNTGRSRTPNFQKLKNLIDRHLKVDEDWQVFESHFSDVHDAFFRSLKHDHPQL
ncbi:MAG: hypothetical protein KDC54_17760, partial [Lewinella sp.]|nr:hypothetical protein [Lewinella sp.]